MSVVDLRITKDITKLGTASSSNSFFVHSQRIMNSLQISFCVGHEYFSQRSQCHVDYYKRIARNGLKDYMGKSVFVLRFSHGSSEIRHYCFVVPITQINR
ncbi:hypothetical protein T02_8659 [Trichinella nativa]|uniref:Uncharacterized protein n=1 Tax=Trichinella nativa TaxID=6335 RepID=A0A0V1KLE5_9BILA|nr:hypothetical protein T02_8659 [Trichinella nativa]